MILPPKRWESAEDSKYDPIRHQKWFWRLQRRKHQIPFLNAAYDMMMADASLKQKKAADIFDVDARELRDYVKFRHNIHAETTEVAQEIIDSAYERYAAAGFDLPFTICMKYAAWHVLQQKRLFHRERAYIEKWETDPTYYPTGYLS